MSRIPTSIAALALVASSAAAQSMNLDLEPSSTAFGRPSTSYGAAAQSPGYWNAVTANPATSLVAANGAPTGASLANDSTSELFLQTDWPGTSGDDQALLDDYDRPEDFGVTWTFDGLANGDYEVYVILVTNNVGRLRVQVLGSFTGLQYVRGGWNGTYVQGSNGFVGPETNYTRHALTVSDGRIRIQVDVVDKLHDYVFVNGMQLVKVGDVLAGIPQCFGDGSGAACPCGNSGATARGCQNSASTGGALLVTSGATSPDTVVLHASGEPPSSLSIFLQGKATVGPLAYGDGLRCAGGILKRLYTGGASGGAIARPAPGDPSITARSAALGDPIPPGERRYYQVYYRDANATFCPAPAGNTFNITNAVKVTW